MIRAILSKRQPDAYGSGEYGANRGSRAHRGIDYACFVGAEILSPIEGKITKLGYAYADDLSYRYVEVVGDDSLHYRVFYVEPSVGVGDMVTRETIIGKAQDISARYTENGMMENHIHYEIFSYEVGAHRVYRNPEL